MHLFLGNLKNPRLIAKKQESEGLPTKNAGIFFEALKAHFDGLSKNPLPYCPDSIVQQLKNYDEMINQSYS
jgi:hypothetical protein